MKKIKEKAKKSKAQGKVKANKTVAPKNKEIKGQGLRVLILEDNAADAELMERQLQREKAAGAFRRAETRAGFLKGLKEFKPDLILADYTLPGFDAMKALKLAREKHPFLPFIVVTGTIGEEKAVACLRAGADDYLLKDRLSRLGQAVRQAMQNRRLQAEKIQLDETLLQATKEWLAIFDSMNDAVCLLGADGAVRRCNKAMNRLLGLPFRRIIGRNCLELICGKQKRAACSFQQAKKDLRRHQEETLWRGRWYQVAVDPIVDDKGRLSGAVHVMTDISEIKGAEKALRASEQRFRRLYDESPVAFQSLDTEGRFIEVNAAWLALFGYHREEVIGKPFPTFLAAGQADLFHGRFAEFLRRKVVHSIEFRMRKKDGDELIISFDGIFLFDIHGKPIHSNCVLQNITERKRAEELLRENEERFRSLYENTSIGMYRTTPDGRILLANSALVRMLGYKKISELASRELEKNGFEPGYPRRDFRERIERDGQVIGLEATWKKHDGTAIFVRESVVAVRDDEGNVRFYDGTVEDITVRRQAEQQIRYQANLLSQVSDAIMATDREFRVQYWNEAAERLYGWKASDVMGRHFLQFIRPRYVAESRAIVMRKIDKDGYWRGELEHGRSDGTYFPVHASISAVRDSKGRIIGHITVNRDISERRQAEEAHQKSKAQLAAALEIAKLGHWELDVESGMFTFSDSLYAIFHTTAREMGGYQMPIAEYARRFVHPEDASQVESETRKALETNDPHFNRIVEHRIRYADGGEGHIAVHYFVVKNAQGKTIKTYGVNQDISERKRMEVALRESEQRYRQLVEMSPDAIAVHAGGKIVFLNPAAVRLSGAKSAEEMLGKSALDMVHPDSRASAAARIQRSLEQGIPAPLFNEKFIRADGSGVDVEVCAVPIIFEGQPAMQVIIRDISERQRAEQALRQSEEKFRTLVENLVEVAFTMDAEGRVTYISPGIKKIFGYAAEEIIGRSFLDFVSEDSRQELSAEMARTLNEPSEFREYKIRTRGGVEKWISISSSPIIENGVPLGMRGIMADVTARKMAEEALLISESKYRLISENSSDVIWLFDIATMRLTYISPSVFNLRGFTVEEAMRQSLEDLFTPESFRVFQKELGDGLATFQAGGESVYTRTIEIDQPHKDGHVVNTEIVATLMVDKRGRPQQILGVSRDITERKQAGERLRTSLAEKEVLLKEIHHRVKNNLQVIAGLLALQEGQLDDERMRQILRESQNRIWTMAMIHQMLYQLGDMTAVDMVEFVRGLVRNLLSAQHRMQAPDISLRLFPLKLSIDKAIPLALVINELMTNAMKHAFPGGRPGKITVTLNKYLEGENRAAAQVVDLTPRNGTRFPAPTHLLCIADDGVGIPPDFEPGKSKSLGMELVSMLTRQIHATTTVERRDGTVFRITFSANG
jgi:PAS domain S-box-containing protein